MAKKLTKNPIFLPILAVASVLGAGALLKKKSSPQPQQGLGFFWIWAKDYYTIQAGTKWLPPRYLTSGSAKEWQLDSMEQYWNQTVTLYKKVGNSWVRA